MDEQEQRQVHPAYVEAAATSAASADSSSSSSSSSALHSLLSSDHSSRMTMHFPAAIPSAASAAAAFAEHLPHFDCGAASGSGSCLIDSEMASAAPLPSAFLTPYPIAEDWSYVNAKILALMVRIGTLPMRLLSLRYGATMAYSEELVAKKLRTCVRSERVYNGTTFIEFTPAHGSHAAQPVAPVESNSAFVASSSAGEDGIAAAASAAHLPSKPAPPAAKPKPIHNQNMKAPATLITVRGERLVVQIGAATADDALAAAQIVARDCRAIDINMGCPKHFSLQGGMGAALLSKPETVADILSTLRRNLNLPITCKIRLLHSEPQMIELVRRIESMGVSALALHARHIEDRPRHRALVEKVSLVSSNLKSIPLIYNGDACFTRSADEELLRIRTTTGAKSIMAARAAMWNASIFRPQSQGGILPLISVVRSYLSVSTEVNHGFANVKYCVLEMLKNHIGSTPLFRDLTRTKSQTEMEKVLNCPLQGMEIYQTLTGEYKVPFVLEERATAAAAASASDVRLDGQWAAANEVEFDLAPSSAAAAAASSSAVPSSAASDAGGVHSSVSIVSDSGAPVASSSDAYGIAHKKMSFTERKYFQKQNRKNRQGRQEQEEQQARATAAEAAVSNGHSAAANSSDQSSGVAASSHSASAPAAGAPAQSD